MTMDPEKAGGMAWSVVPEMPETWCVHEIRVLYLIGGAIVRQLRIEGKLTDNDHTLHAVKPDAMIREIEKIGEDMQNDETEGKALCYKFMGLPEKDQGLLVMSMLAVFSCYGVHHFTPDAEIARREVSSYE